MAVLTTELECVTALRTLVVAGERYRRVLAERHGLNISETLVLTTLRTSGTPLTPKAIADALDLRSGTLTAMLDRLEDAGMIERAPHPTDRRARLVVLTPIAEQMITRSTEGLVEDVAQAADLVPLDRLSAAMEAIAGALDIRSDAMLEHGL